MKHSIKLLKDALGIRDTGAKVVFVFLKKKKPMTAKELGLIIGKDRTTVMKQITIMFNQDILSKKVHGKSPAGYFTTYALDKKRLSDMLITYIEKQKSLSESAYCALNDCKFSLTKVLNYKR